MSFAAEAMTEEEEARLLAEYGTSDAFDMAVQIEAVSCHRNVFNQGDLFLTGGNVAGQDEIDRIGPSDSSRMHYMDPMMPLSLMLLQYEIGNAGGAGSSLSMAEAVSSLEKQSGAAASRGSEVVIISDEAVRRTRKFMDEMELLITGGRTIAPATRSIVREGEVGGEEESLTNLLAEVDKELMNTDYHFTAARDPEFARQLAEERERHLADLSPVHQPEVFDDDADLIDLVESEKIAEAVQSRPLEPILDESEKQIFAEMEAAEVVTFARREKQAVEATQLAVHSVKQAQEEIDVFVASLPVQPSMDEVLAKISTIESRDTAMEVEVRAQVLATQRQKAATTFDKQLLAANESKSAAGQMAFVPLASKIDTLLPPPVASSASQDQRASGVATENTPAAIATTKRGLSVAALQKRNAVKDVMLRREATERRLMRIEEERVISAQRNLDGLLVRIAADKKAVFSAEDAARHQTKADEAIAYADLVLREQRARQEVSQLLRSKALVQEAKAKNNLSQEEQACRLAIESTETFGFDDLDKAQKEERAATERRLAATALLLRQVEAQLLARFEEDAEAQLQLRAKHGDGLTRRSLASLHQDAYGDSFPSYSDIAALQTSGEVCGVGHGARSVVLQKQLTLRQQWSHDNRAAITTCLQGISIALNAAVSQQQRGGLRKRGQGPLSDGRGTPLQFAEMSPADVPVLAVRENSEEVNLNAKLIRKVNAQLFAAAALAPNRIPQLFRFISAALEGLTSIDYASIKNLSVVTTALSSSAPSKVFEQSTNAACIHVGKFVRHLNLSGNSLASLSFQRLLDALPSLRSLNVSDNALDVSSYSASSDATESDAAAAGSSLLTALDISANKVVDFSFLAASPNLVTLSAYSNRITSSDALKLSPRLSTLEISRNKLTELTGLAPLVTLSSVDASRNAVSEISMLEHNLLLTKLFLSSNQITAFPARLPLALLRQLFLSENKLTSVPRELMWLPLLSVLHLDSNQIQDISGVAFCPFLVTLRVAFNQLSNPSDMMPLISCKRLENLAINDNPVMLMQSTAQDAMQIVLASCPLLRDLNNEPVKEPQRQSAVAQVLTKRNGGFFVAAAALWGENINWESATAIEGILRFSSSWASSLSSVHASTSGTRERLGFAFDRHLHQLQQEYDVVTVANNRKLQNAIATEECLTDRLKSRSGGTLASSHHMSDSIAEQNYIESLQMSQSQLLALRDAPTPQLCFNRHTASAAYAHRAQQQREQQAKRFVADWIFRRLLCRKAVREFQVMREASEAGRIRRYERAAKIIQPVWRGAWVRNRLRKAKVLDDDDDDELFQKVEVGDLGAAISKGPTSSLFQTAIASHPQAPRFDVASFVGSSAKLEAAGEAVRPSSNPTARRDSSSGFGLLGTEPQRASSPPPQRSQLDEEWSNAISSQIRKKNKKMEAGRAEAIRKEFLTDPLKAKSRLGGAK